MDAKDTASPDFCGQLGQLAKFCRLMGFKPEEIQIVIDDPESRAIIQRRWQQVCYPPEVRLVKRIFAEAPAMPLVELHSWARKLELPIFLSALHSDEAQVLDLRLGLTRDKALTMGETARELGISIDAVQHLHAAALWALNQHVSLRDREVAQKLPIGVAEVVGDPQFQTASRQRARSYRRL